MSAWSVNPWVEVLTAYRRRAPELIIEACRAYERFILEANRRQLQERGRDSEGASLGTYAASTIRYKISRGQAYDRVTLRDSGDFHRSFTIRYDQDELAIYADDDKTPKLVRRYGTDILGLAEADITKLIELVRPDFLDAFRKAMLS